MANETLLVCPGDDVWTAGGPPAELARFDRYVGPLPAGLVERPDELTELRYKGRAFRVKTRIDAASGVLHGVYATHGMKGVEAFFKENDFVPRIRAAGRVVVTERPEQFLSGPRLDLYRLFREAARDLDERREAVLAIVAKAAHAGGLARLESERPLLAEQVLRYFQGIDGARGAAGVLATDFRPFADLLDESTRGVKQLRAELGVLAPFIRRADEAQQAWRTERSRAYLQIERERPLMSRMGPEATRDIVDLRFAEEAARQVQERFPEVAQLERLAKEQRDALAAEVAAAASAHPVLWRIYTLPADASAGQLGSAILSELRATWRANRDLAKDLSGDETLVWRLPPLVRGALADAGADLYSTPWTAAEERIEKESGLRAAAAVSMTAGLAHLGLTGLALLAGGSLAPPLGVALFAVEAVSALVDAVQEYRAYRLQRAAFRASLDPAQALALEPSLFSTALTIGFDLLALVPPARAARAP